MKIIINFVANAISLFLISLLISGVELSSIGALLFLALILGLLNISIKPILKILSIPARILTFGLFSIVINTIVLKLAFMLVPGAGITGFVTTIWASILLSIVNSIVHSIIDKD